MRVSRRAAKDAHQKLTLELAGDHNMLIYGLGIGLFGVAMFFETRRRERVREERKAAIAAAKVKAVETTQRVAEDIQGRREKLAQSVQEKKQAVKKRLSRNSGEAEEVIPAATAGEEAEEELPEIVTKQKD